MFLALHRYSMFSFPVDWKSSHEWYVNVGVPQIVIPGLFLFLMYIDYLSGDKTICIIASYTNDTTLYVNVMEILALICSKCHLTLFWTLTHLFPKHLFSTP